MIRLLLKPIQHWVWRDAGRRANLLLRFSEVEEDSRRDLVRAAELTRDARLRQLFLRHASDERRHAELFHRRGVELLRDARSGRSAWEADWLSPGERGLDDVRIERDRDGPLLAFLHLSEGAAVHQFADYRGAVGHDPATQTMLDRIIRDEQYHAGYSRAELARVAPDRQRRLLWSARLERAWKAYLRFAVGLAGLISTVVLTLQYFVLLPPFAWAAKRGARREAQGWTAIAPERNGRLDRQY